MPVEEDYAFIRKMPDNLQKLREDHFFCDVILRSGVREIYAHRIILAMASDYFSILFKYEGGFQQPPIHFDHNIVTGECLDNIVNYAYSGKINICEENVLDLLLAADYFIINFIKKKCEEFMTEKLIVYRETDVKSLPCLIWAICHFNLSHFVEPICAFMAKNFTEIADCHLFNSISSCCFLTLLSNKKFTILDHGIPVDNVELELLKLVVLFINENNPTEENMSQLLGAIQFTEIPHQKILSIMGDCPRIQKSEEMNHILNFKELPQIKYTADDHSIENSTRKFSISWKHVNGLQDRGNSDISVDDRIHKVKVLVHTGIPLSKPKKIYHGLRYGIGDDIRGITSIKGLMLTYQSGMVFTLGDLSGESISPFDQVDEHEFSLEENEVIVKIAHNYGNLNYIKFYTNLGNEFGPFGKDIDYYSIENETPPRGNIGYFHSFESRCTIDNLKCLWVEYSEPRFGSVFTTNHLQQQFERLHWLSVLQGLGISDNQVVYYEDSDDHYYDEDYDYFDGGNVYDTSDSDY